MKPRHNGPSALHDGQAVWAKHRELRILDGTWMPFVPIDRARSHIAGLRRQGLSVRSIAHAAGLPLSTVAPIAWPDYHPRRTKVRPEVEAAILRVAPRVDALPPGAYLPAAGTIRRVRALQAIGWPLDQLAARLGVHTQSLSRMCTKANEVTVERARAVLDLYDELSMTPGPSEKTRRRAEREGWAPPLAWDDDEIDDPKAAPHIPDQGRRGPHSAYSAEEAAALLADGWTLEQIAERFQVKPNTVYQRIRRAEQRETAA
jgi:lambda repressor-like predicted transcriptional regulator